VFLKNGGWATQTNQTNRNLRRKEKNLNLVNLYFGGGVFFHVISDGCPWGSFRGVTCAQTGCIMGVQCLYYGTTDFNNESLLQIVVPVGWFSLVYWPGHGSCSSSPCTHQSLAFRRVRTQVTDHFRYKIFMSLSNFHAELCISYPFLLQMEVVKYLPHLATLDLHINFSSSRGWARLDETPAVCKPPPALNALTSPRCSLWN
jgi:hypothetical protein